MTTTCRDTALPLLLIAFTTLSACSSYNLQGYVVASDYSNAALIKADNSQDTASPVSRAQVTFTLDPQSLGRETIGTTYTDSQGFFSIPVKKFGAGFLEYKLGILARAKGFQTTSAVVDFPSPGKNVLIFLKPGVDTYRETPDPMQDYQNYR